MKASKCIPYMPALVLLLLAFLFVVGNGFRKLVYLHIDVLFVI